MKKLKGIGLLLLSNILIFITLSITFTILMELVLPAFGIDLRGSFVQQDLLWAFRHRIRRGLRQPGVFQTNGANDAGLPADYPTPPPRGTTRL